MLLKEGYYPSFFEYIKRKEKKMAINDHWTFTRTAKQTRKINNTPKMQIGGTRL